MSEERASAAAERILEVEEEFGTNESAAFEELLDEYGDSRGGQMRTG